MATRFPQSLRADLGVSPCLALLTFHPTPTQEPPNEPGRRALVQLPPLEFPNQTFLQFITICRSNRPGVPSVDKPPPGRQLGRQFLRHYSLLRSPAKCRRTAQMPAPATTTTNITSEEGSGAVPPENSNCTSRGAPQSVPNSMFVGVLKLSGP